MKAALIGPEHYSEEMNRVRAQLDALRTAGTFSRSLGEKVYFELYRAENAKGWIALSHGFTENTLKYTELIWYLLGEGWSVAICDHRGHGKSFRQVEPRWLTHVEHFEDYVDDYACFLKHVVMPRLEGQPLAVLGHSMGGAIAAHVAEQHPELPIEKLVLCSPMVAPATSGTPRWIAGAASTGMCLLGKGKECNFAQHEYDGEDDFGQPWCCATSHERHHWYWELQREHEEYQNSAATYAWLREAIAQTGKLLRRSNARRLKMPVLLLQAGQDTMVDNCMEDKLVERLPNARKLIFPDARHEIFRCTDPEVKLFVDVIADFLQE